MIYKCKICGGNLDVQDTSKIVTCEYCGTKQTLPKLESDKIANLYDRANHFRRNNEYDKAEALYEMILNENTKDAEAYWSLILCKYGVEYIKDPKTHEYIPTCNRTLKQSIFADEDYKMAIENASEEEQEIYKKQAEEINKIQKRILEISNNEEPFDVFICYKETDENGQRTQDSVMAQEIYQGLIKEGLKVFFARITLEDKIGTEYEPYIYSALNSAKVMLVIGTKKEHFEAVWVKNEWSRYLTFIKEGAKKTLIPCYNKMDPYNLPEEFASLQAQDMSKIGFMQDLIRGIEKLITRDNQTNQVKVSYKPSMTEEQKQEIYNNSKKDMQMANDAKVLSHREKAKIFLGLAKDFERIGAYLDSAELARICEERYKEEKHKQTIGIIKKLVIFIIAVIIVGGLLMKFVIIPKSNYDLALENYNNNKYYSAIKELEKLGDYKDSKKIVENAKQEWRKSAISTVCSTTEGVLAVKSIGTVFNLSDSFNNIKNVAQIEYANDYIFILKDNGTVIGIPTNEKSEELELNWNNIVTIKVSYDYVFGLRNDGTVLTKKYNVEEKGNIDTSDWEDIVQITACLRGVVGLKEDGTLVQEGLDKGYVTKINEWRDIVDITGANSFLIGLKEDGTLMAAGGNSYGILDVEKEKDIIQLSCSNYFADHFSFIKSDGSVKAIGYNQYGQCAIASWQNVVYLYNTDRATIGITKDGKLLIQGNYKEDYLNNPTTWSNIKVYDEWRAMR